MRKLFGSKLKKKAVGIADDKVGKKTSKKTSRKTGVKTDTKSGKKTNAKITNKANSKAEKNPNDITDNKTDDKSVNRKKKRRPQRRKQILYGSLMVVGVFFIAAALRAIIGGLVEDDDARSEYELLRESFPAVSNQTPLPDIEQTPVPEVEEEEEEESIEEELDLRSLSLDELAALNRDFIGWITIGRSIDYPVVRAGDNAKYMNTTFLGRRNTAGAIFMDFRHTGGFDEKVGTIYGHNTRDGSMFSPLIQYLNPAMIQSNPTVSITARNGKAYTYRIFDARLTDAWDEAYTIGVSDQERASEVFAGAPENASHFLLLSTCTRSRDDDERILVLAAR